MDPIRNPFAPGAGSPPPELAGRDELRETVRVAVERTRAGKSARSVLMVGLRGVGKTMLLDRMRDDAEGSGVHTIRIEAPEDRSLPALLAPQLRVALLRLSKLAHAKDLVVRGLRALGILSRRPAPGGDLRLAESRPSRHRGLRHPRRARGRRVWRVRARCCRWIGVCWP